MTESDQAKFIRQSMNVIEFYDSLLNSLSDFCDTHDYPELNALVNAHLKKVLEKIDEQ